MQLNNAPVTGRITHIAAAPTGRVSTGSNASPNRPRQFCQKKILKRLKEMRTAVLYGSNPNLQKRFREKVEKRLECSICFELFVRATSLNCSHTFCEECISTWLLNNTACPMCRKNVTSRTRSEAIDNFLEQIKKDFPTDATGRILPTESARSQPAPQVPGNMPQIYPRTSVNPLQHPQLSTSTRAVAIPPPAELSQRSQRSHNVLRAPVEYSDMQFYFHMQVPGEYSNIGDNYDEYFFSEDSDEDDDDDHLSEEELDDEYEGNEDEEDDYDEDDGEEDYDEEGGEEEYYGEEGGEEGSFEGSGEGGSYEEGGEGDLDEEYYGEEGGEEGSYEGSGGEGSYEEDGEEGYYEEGDEEYFGGEGDGGEEGGEEGYFEEGDGGEENYYEEGDVAEEDAEGQDYGDGYYDEGEEAVEICGDENFQEDPDFIQDLEASHENDDYEPDMPDYDNDYNEPDMDYDCDYEDFGHDDYGEGYYEEY